MNLAEELLRQSANESGILGEGVLGMMKLGNGGSMIGSEPHIVIGRDRVITVPDELKRIAVQFDHNIETVTFDCPRYWDNHDMSQMDICINYVRSDGFKGCYNVSASTVDDADETLMHFNWTIDKDVTQVAGQISFLVGIKITDDAGNDLNRWSSELNKDLYVSEGLECVSKED